MRKKRKRMQIHRRSVVDAGKRLLSGVLCMAMITQLGADYATVQAAEVPPVYLKLYGEDYELEMEGVRETGDGESILEKYVKGKAVTSVDEPLPVAASSEPEEGTFKSFEEVAAESKSTGTRQARRQGSLWKQNRKSKALWIPLWANLWRMPWKIWILQVRAQ